jgi:hypothetical protein
MIRTIALAVSALAVTVAPVSAAELRVKISGKSAEQVRADIVKAASTVCWADVRGEAMAGYMYPACVRASVNDAVAKINNPQLTAANVAAGSVSAAKPTKRLVSVPKPGAAQSRRVLLVWAAPRSC